MIFVHCYQLDLCRLCFDDVWSEVMQLELHIEAVVIFIWAHMRIHVDMAKEILHWDHQLCRDCCRSCNQVCQRCSLPVQCSRILRRRTILEGHFCNYFQPNSNILFNLADLLQTMSVHIEHVQL